MSTSPTKDESKGAIVAKHLSSSGSKPAASDKAPFAGRGGASAASPVVSSLAPVSRVVTKESLAPDVASPGLSVPSPLEISGPFPSAGGEEFAFSAPPSTFQLALPETFSPISSDAEDELLLGQNLSVPCPISISVPVPSTPPIAGSLPKVVSAVSSPTSPSAFSTAAAIVAHQAAAVGTKAPVSVPVPFSVPASLPVSVPISVPSPLPPFSAPPIPNPIANPIANPAAPPLPPRSSPSLPNHAPASPTYPRSTSILTARLMSAAPASIAKALSRPPSAASSTGPVPPPSASPALPPAPPSSSPALASPGAPPSAAPTASPTAQPPHARTAHGPSTPADLVKAPVAVVPTARPTAMTTPAPAPPPGVASVAASLAPPAAKPALSSSPRPHAATTHLAGMHHPKLVHAPVPSVTQAPMAVPASAVAAARPPASIVAGRVPSVAPVPSPAPIGMSVAPITIPNPTPVAAPPTPTHTPGTENTGRWTAEEHRLFLQGLEQHGKGWKKIAGLIKSRTVVQIRTHAQKYFQKLAKARQNGEVAGAVGINFVGGGAATNSVVQNSDGVAIATAIDGSSILLPADGSQKANSGMAIHPSHSAIGAGGMALGTSRIGSTSTHSGGMTLGTDPASLAAAAGAIGTASNSAMVTSSGGKRRRAAPSGSKRRAIGGVVRSAVREGRNLKRQKIAENKRAANEQAVGQVTTNATSPTPASSTTDALMAAEPVSSNGTYSSNQVSSAVPNPLPSVSKVLDPFVIKVPHHPAPISVTGASAPPLSQGTTNVPAPTTAAPGQTGFPPKPGMPKTAPTNRGRTQMVHTATHGTLPMAALEDAVFRLLTPATGAPAPPLPQASPAPTAVLDPLAPNAVKIPVSHTLYQAPGAVPGPTSAQPNSSPTCVTDLSNFPSWVDAKNPPSWYNEGSDIDRLLEDAECLNWLSDTGDLEETYAPPPLAAVEEIRMCDPSPVTSLGREVPSPVENPQTSLPPPPAHSHAAAPSCADTPSLLSASEEANHDVEPIEIKLEDVGLADTVINGVNVAGVVHPSTESLSFLVDSPEGTEEPVAYENHADQVAHLPLHSVNHIVSSDASSIMPTFLSGPEISNDHTTGLPSQYASATEAMTAISEQLPHPEKLQSDSDTGLMGFPDLDMGDEQAFVSALLENSGQSSISFPKLHSDLGAHIGNVGTSNGTLVEHQDQA